jgi:hypothetical protein
MHKDFKMNKSVKRLLALGSFKSEQQRSDFKRMMIQAQCAEERHKRDSLKSKGKDKDE